MEYRGGVINWIKGEDTVRRGKLKKEEVKEEDSSYISTIVYIVTK